MSRSFDVYLVKRFITDECYSFNGSLNDPELEDREFMQYSETWEIFPDKAPVSNSASDIVNSLRKKPFISFLGDAEFGEEALNDYFSIENGISLKPYEYASGSTGDLAFGLNYEIIMLNSRHSLCGKYMQASPGLVLCFEKLTTIKCADSSHESIEELIYRGFSLLDEYIKKNVEKLQLFLLQEEWKKDIDTYTTECLPPAITFKSGEAIIPGAADYQGTMCQHGYMAYCSALSTFGELLGNDVSIRIYTERGYVSFELQKNVWLDFLIDTTDKAHSIALGAHHGGTYWWNQDETNEILSEQLKTPEGFCELMAKHNVEHLQYNSFVRYDDGEYVCYTFTGFSANRQAVIKFQIYPFDIGSFLDWFRSVHRLSKFKIQQSASFEYDWGVDEIEEYSMYLTPVYPDKVSKRYGLMLAITTQIKSPEDHSAIKSKTIRFKGDSKILSTALNVSPEMSGFAMPPMPIKFSSPQLSVAAQNSAISEIFSTFERWFDEAFEMGLDIESSDELYAYIANEASLHIDKGATYLMVSLFVLEHPQDEIDDFIIGRSLPTGTVKDTSVINEMNRMFPGNAVTGIMFAPLFRGS